MASTPVAYVVTILSRARIGGAVRRTPAHQGLWHSLKTIFDELPSSRRELPGHVGTGVGGVPWEPLGDNVDSAARYWFSSHRNPVFSPGIC